MAGRRDRSRSKASAAEALEKLREDFLRELDVDPQEAEAMRAISSLTPVDLDRWRELMAASRRDRIRMDKEALARDGRWIIELADGEQWAKWIKGESDRVRVRALDWYRDRWLGLAPSADAHRNAIARGKRFGKMLGEARRDPSPDDHLSGFHTLSDAEMVRQIHAYFRDLRSSFETDEILRMDLVNPWKEGIPGAPSLEDYESSRIDRQSAQLVFLAHYSQQNPPLSPDWFILDAFSRAGNWLQMQQHQIANTPRVPQWRLFRRLCTEGLLDAWFVDLYAHQRFLYCLGEAAANLNYAAAHLLMRLDSCDAQSREVILELVLRMSDMYVKIRAARWVQPHPPFQARP